MIITVQFDNPADTLALVASLGRLHDVAHCELLVVDNSTTRHHATEEAALQPIIECPVRVFRTQRNLYYWGGVAFALESLYEKRSRWPRWTLVCNNDVVIEDPLFLGTLRSLSASTYPVIAPRIISRPAGRDQNPMFESPPGLFKRLKWLLYDVDYHIAKSMLAIHEALGMFLRRRTRRQSANETIQGPRRIYAPHGACMIFSSAFFERGGELDTTVPMFAEEMTIAALARHLGLPVWYYPALQVFHREHSTTGHELTRTKYEMERMARQRYYKYPTGRVESAVEEDATLGSSAV
ncbi:MAG: glycosyltransferase family 2 protein [Gemmatimonadaceae bacterium]